MLTMTSVKNRFFISCLFIQKLLARSHRRILTHVISFPTSPLQVFLLVTFPRKQSGKHRNRDDRPLVDAIANHLFLVGNGRLKSEIPTVHGCQSDARNNAHAFGCGREMAHMNTRTYRLTRIGQQTVDCVLCRILYKGNHYRSGKDLLMTASHMLSSMLILNRDFRHPLQPGMQTRKLCLHRLLSCNAEMPRFFHWMVQYETPEEKTQ